MKRREALATLGGAALIGPALLSCKKRSTIMKKEIKTGKAPEAIGPYSQAEEQTRLVLTNLKAVMEAAGSSMANVIKCTVFLQDLEDYAVMNSIYGDFFSSPYPARAAVQVARLPKDVKVEIEAIAVK